jgi:hypothetical protein
MARRFRGYKPRPTPEHIVRLERVRVEIDPAKQWFVVKVPGRREREVERSLKAAGFATWRPVQQQFVERARGAVELERRELPGHVFAGVPGPQDGRQALGQWWSAQNAALPPVTFLDARTGISQEICGGAPEPLRMSVVGPFRTAELQAFADEVGSPAVAVLYVHGRPEFVFPAATARLAADEAAWLRVA